MGAHKIFNPKLILCVLGIIAVLWVSPHTIYSQAPAPGHPTFVPPKKEASKTEVPKESTEATMAADINKMNPPSIITQASVLALFALLPFIIMMLTSFLKLVVVLSLLRTALGVQQAPPNQVINGIALILSLYIMYPTVLKMYDSAQAYVSQVQVPNSLLSPGSAQYIMSIADTTKEPLRDFLKKNSLPKHQILFYRLSYKVLPEIHRADLKPDDFIILMPAFITSQLKDAFEIGVLIYIPFFVIDLVTSNVLLAMGMMMLSPVTISMPLKLFLLVMLDGWTLLIEGLVNTFSQ